MSGVEGFLDGVILAAVVGWMLTRFTSIDGDDEKN